MRRVIFLGLDGQNPEFVEKYLDHLPNFRRMIENGSWGPLLSTFPCDTPTNWTALATGAPASSSGITGFAFHKPGTSLRSKIFGPKAYAEFRNAEFIWESAASQSATSILINYPFSWHSRESDKLVIVGGDTIAGGRPEIVDCGCFCSSGRAESVEDAKVRDTNLDSDGIRRGELIFVDGVRYEWTATGVEKIAEPTPERPDNPTTLRLRTEIHGSRMHVLDSTGRSVATLKKGEWSEYFAIPFEPTDGWCKLFLADLDPESGDFILFHSPITWGTGWSKPLEIAELLTRESGPYQQAVETKGNLFTKGWFGEFPLEANLALLNDCGELFAKYAKTLARRTPDWRMMFIQLHSTDGMNHKRLCHIDPTSPLSNDAKAEETDRWFLELYKATDVILGKIAAIAEEHGAAIVVTSDHSAIPTHTWVDTARPFVEKGMLFFDNEGIWDESRSSICKKINHSIYINLKGRQPLGIVEPRDYESMRDDIIGTLLKMRDPRTGECPIAVAARREDMASIGANSENFGDIVYLMRPGYTNQPASEYEELTLDRLASFVAEPEKGLSEGYCFHQSILGNHHDYMPNAEYPGVCTNRGVLLFYGPGMVPGGRIRGANTIDVAPTICEYIGIRSPSESEGKILPCVVSTAANLPDRLPDY